MNDQVCPKCKGTGWAPDENNREVVHRCQCRFMDRLLTKSERANIPQRFAGAELEFYIVKEGEDSKKNAKKIVKKFIEDYPAVNEGLLLQGSTGKGKTRLLCTIATELMKKFEDIDIYYIDWNDLVREMGSGETHASRDFSSISVLVNKLCEAEVLLFDELAASKASQWVYDNIYYLLNKRYNNRKITVLASNFFDDNPSTISETGETLTQRIGVRLRGRLHEMAKTVLIEGEDYRAKYFSNKSKR